jgi:ribosomal protein L34
MSGLRKCRPERTRGFMLRVYSKKGQFALTPGAAHPCKVVPGMIFTTRHVVGRFAYTIASSTLLRCLRIGFGRSLGFFASMASKKSVSI